MKILAINNYSIDRLLRLSSQGTASSQHTWGADHFIAQGHEADTLLLKNSRWGGGKFKHLHDILYFLVHLRHLRRYDAIIAFANPLIGWLALFKTWGLLHSRLYTVVHHHVPHMFLFSGYDRIFFLSRQVMEFTRQSHPSLAGKMEYLEWGPDLPFYESTYQAMQQRTRETPPVLISTGKTSRDLPLMIDACQELDLHTIIITDVVQTSLPMTFTAGGKGENALPGDEMRDLMAQSDISVIPVVAERSKESLCGLTSFLDALALGQPIIISDNTNISVDIDALRIGLTYKAGDKEDFERQVTYMVEHPAFMDECGRNARKYALAHSYEHYCRQLLSAMQA